MIGVIIVAHGGLADAFAETVEMIVGRSDNFKACSFPQGSDAEQLRKMLKQSINDVDDGSGVVILTDMFGGTPSNISLSFLDGSNIEVITGVNLPMVITALTKRTGRSMDELVRVLKSSGCNNIYIASEVLAANLDH